MYLSECLLCSSLQKIANLLWLRGRSWLIVQEWYRKGHLEVLVEMDNCASCVRCRARRNIMDRMTIQETRGKLCNKSVKLDQFMWNNKQQIANKRIEALARGHCCLGDKRVPEIDRNNHSQDLSWTLYWKCQCEALCWSNPENHDRETV